MRRMANWPNGSLAGTAGATSGHHATTGVSGSRKGVTTLLACPASGPDSLSTTTSPAPASPPTRIWASSLASVASRATGSTTITRQGCSRLAALAASMESSRTVSLSGAITRVSTLAIVNAPPSSRRPSSFLLTALVVVSSRSTIMARLLLVPLLARASLRCSLVVAFADHYGLRHSRPVRWSISNAESGPQLPASYGSGLPCDAQYSNAGSKIFQDNSTSWFTGNNEGSPSSTSSIKRS